MKDIYQNPIIRYGSVAVAAGSLLALTACGVTSKVPDEPSVAEGCATNQAHELPSATNVQTIKDDGRTYIRACNYLQDMGLSYSSASMLTDPAPLQRVKATTLETTNFKLRSNFGGWAFLGVGSINGETKADGSTTVKDVFKIRVADTEGAFAIMTLDAEKVRVKPCASDADCVPSMQVTVPDNIMFKKEKVDDKNNILTDTTSIWASGDQYQCEENNFFGDKEPDCQASLDQRNSLMSELTTPPGDAMGVGGPKTPGEIVSALATRITLTVPIAALQDS